MGAANLIRNHLTMTNIASKILRQKANSGQSLSMRVLTILTFDSINMAVVRLNKYAMNQG